MLAGLPTKAVPAPVRIGPIPAHKLGASSRLSRLPLYNACIRAWPTESDPLLSNAWNCSIWVSETCPIRSCAFRPLEPRTVQLTLSIGI
ncbi:hypothetical protein D9M73_169900 [compost metagenome]